MEEDIKIENIKDGCKISVPIISNQELDDFNNILDIETEYEKLIKKVSEQVYKEKECILLQQIIKKQEQTLENLIARNKELEEKNKKVIEMLQEHIKHCEQEVKGSLNNEICHIALNFDKHLLQELLQEGDK